MADMEAKELVVDRFLAFVARRVPLPLARLATLGGYGIEAKAWQSAGIPPEHGSLIEVDTGLARMLIKEHRYRVHEKLKDFHHVMRNFNETVDGFHLDLCGTVDERVAGEFAPALPFILGSTGRCLAVTVADARRNAALEQWRDVFAEGKGLFGRNTAMDLFRETVAMQRQIPVKKYPDLPAHFSRGFDAAKGAKREFGLLVEMADLLCRHKSTLAHMERYVYVSRYKERPFRMRTYLFHFGEGGSKDPEVTLARKWVESPLFFLDGGEFIEVNGHPDASRPAAPIMEKSMTSKLAQLAALAGPDVQEELAGYVADRLRLQQILEAFKASGVGINGKAKPTASVSPDQAVKKNWSDLSPKEQLEFRMKVCETRIQHFAGGGAYSAWCKDILPGLIKDELGRMPRNFTKSVGAMTARMGGKFRAAFIEQVKGTLDPQDSKSYLDRLQALPKEMPK